MMTKKITKKELEQQITQGFDDWDKLLTEMETQALKGNMPLLSETMKLGKSILKEYAKAWKVTVASLDDE